MIEKWREHHWGDLVTLEYGKGLRGYESSIGSYPVYGTNGLIGKHIEPLCPHPGVIVGRKGAYRGVHYSNKPFFVIDTAFYLKPKADIDLKWAYYELLTQDINSMDSGSAIPSTSRDAFYNLSVKVPPLPEQKAIASILGALDDKIELNRKINETLEAMARAIFKSWFVDFLPVHAKMATANKHVPSLPAAKEGQWFVYALECEDGSFYIGYTEDLQQRWQQHVCGKGAQWTKAHPPIRIAHCETLSSQQEAVKREKWLKTGFGRKWLKRQVVANARTQTGDPIPGLGPHKEWHDSLLGKIPQGWRVGTIGNICTVRGGFAYKSKTFCDNGYPVIKIKNINADRTISIDDVEYIPEDIALKTRDFWLSDGDLIMAMTGATVGKFGLVINKSLVPAVLNQRVAKFFPFQEHGGLTWFIYGVLQSQEIIEQIITIADGSAQPNISANGIMSPKIIVPQDKLIKMFNTHVDSMFKQLISNQKQSCTLAAIRDALLPKLLSGEIRDKDAEKFVESVV